MCASLRNRSDVMHECREDVSPLLFAHLTERMPRQVTITNPAPRAAISGVLIVAAHEMLVMSLHCFLVRLTVTAFSVGKIRTARHAAGTFRLSRHCVTSSLLTVCIAYKRSTAVAVPLAFSSLYYITEII